MQGELALFCHKGEIAKIPFFHCEDKLERRRFVIALAPLMQRRTFCQYEVICRTGMPAEALYLIRGGIGGCGTSVVRRGEYFGDEMLMSNAVSRSTVIAMTFLDTMRLARDDVLQLLSSDEYPKTKRMVRKAAFKMVLQTFVRNVGIAHRMQLNAKRMSHSEIAQWKRKCVAHPAVPQSVDKYLCRLQNGFYLIPMRRMAAIGKFQ